MKIAVDTTVLVSAVVRDGRAQASVAIEVLTDAEAHGIQATPYTPQTPIRMGEALATLGREIGLTNEDFEVLDQVRDKTPAQPHAFDVPDAADSGTTTSSGCT